MRIDGEEFEDGGFLRVGAGPTAPLRGLNGGSEDGGEIGGEGVFQFDDACLIDGLAVGGVELFDEFDGFEHFTRGSLNEEGIGAGVGNDLNCSVEAGLLFKISIDRSENRGCRGVFEAPNDLSAERLAQLAWAIAHPARVRIVRLLLSRKNSM